MSMDRSANERCRQTEGQAAFGWREAAAYALIPVVLTVTNVLVHRSSQLFGGELLNPDSYMRLARLQGILEARMPVHVVARDGSGAGAVNVEFALLHIEENHEDFGPFPVSITVQGATLRDGQ